MFKTFGDKTTKFFYDGAKLLCQENETDNLYFYYGTEGVTAFKYNGIVYHYKKDMLGNILGIYDGNNNLLAKYVYDAWGNHKTFALTNGEWVDITDQTAYNETDDIATKIAILNPFRYRSYYFDIETGYYYLQSRYYDPQVGRFLSPDSLEYLDPETIHGLNLFAYCANNPVMAIDPSGHMPTWAKFLIGAAIIAILAVATVFTVGAAIGGAAGGIVGAATGNLALSAEISDAVTGFCTTASTMLITNISGNTDYSAKEIFIESSVDSMANVVFGTIIPNTNFNEIIEGVSHALVIDFYYGLKNSKDKINKWIKERFNFDLFS